MYPGLQAIYEATT